MISIYKNKSETRLKWAVVALALIIGIVSIIYTQILVEQLAEREQRQIALFAKVQSLAVNMSDNENVNFLVTEFLDVNYSIPVILADEKGVPIYHRNIIIPEGIAEEVFLKQAIQEMKAEHKPIEVFLDVNWKQYIYYKNSKLIDQLRYFPYVQLTVICIFFILAYFIFSTSRRAEQNRVWVGLAKETAHQLGTPLSSLMAWLEYFKADESFDANVVIELEKDVKRLEMITLRFSSIGSEPVLKIENIETVITEIMTYLQTRLSSKIKIHIINELNEELLAPLNRPLFEWVIENLCKNAVDAMSGAGKIDIIMRSIKNNEMIQIDISDTGKGIPSSQIKNVFEAGFTTKKRGWGLGLTLVKRIVEEYHGGRIWVLKSEIDVGTTFRILIPS